MFTLLIDQIEHVDNSSKQSCCVGQVYEVNEIIQLGKQKLIDKNKVPVPNKARLLKRPTILIFFSGANTNSVLSLTES